MKQFLLTSILLFAGVFSLVAQSSWDGGAGTTNWQDANNWNPDGVPAVGSIVTIGTSVTITGTAANAPARIVINGSSTVTLDLNVAIGDGVIEEHPIKVQSNATLNLGTVGNSRVFTLNAPTTRDGIQHNANTNPATINIISSTTLNIIQARDGIAISGTGGNVVNNEGTIDITNANSDGLYLSTGSFVNNGGTLNIDDANTNGINNTSGGTFTNQSNGIVLIENTSLTTNNGIETAGAFTNTSGTITIDNANTDGVEHNSGTLSNQGIMTITSTATNTNNGIVVGSTLNNTGAINVSGVDVAGLLVEAGAIFTNDGTITTNSAGSGTVRHAIFVEDGTLTNNGDITASVNESNARTARTGTAGNLVNNATMSLSGGNESQRFRVEGIATNDFDAALDLGNGRVVLALNASFTNNGLLISTRSSPPVNRSDAGALATNNGFYDANNGNSANFSNGSMGTETDNGIDLNDLADTQINAGMSCDIDLANQPYTWTDGASYTATAASNGNLTLPDDTFDSDPITLSTTIQGTVISLEIGNICPAALPVELLSFNGVPLAKSVLLKWQTVTETNSDYMAVEHSEDGRNFTEIGRLAGAGNSLSMIDYELIDEKPGQGINYYRLRQVDFDGATAYSEVVTVRFTGNTDQEVPVVYPTVIRNGEPLYLDLQNHQLIENETWYLLNDHGQQIALFHLEAGRIHDLSLPVLPAGRYLLTSTTLSKQMTLRFIIAK